MYAAIVPSGRSGPARSTSTDEPSSSSTSLRDLRTFSLSVSTDMPWATLAEHDGVRARPPVSTTHMRQTPSGTSVWP